MFADIIVDISHEQLDRTFQYRIPEDLEAAVEIGVMVNIPFGRGNRMITGYVVELSEAAKFDVDRIKPIDSVVEDKVRAAGKMIRLAAWLKRNYGSTMNQALKTVIPVKEKIRQKEKKKVLLAVSIEEAQETLQKFIKKNATARVRLLSALIETPALEADMIKDKLNITMQTVNSLETLGIVRIETEQLYRNPIRKDQGTEQKVELNAEQKYLVDTFNKEYDEKIYGTYLIHGITGSGKTLCYMEMIEHVVSQGRQVIMLIPEIALTFQTVQRFYRRFGERVSIINSRMSKGERYDQFLRAMGGEIDIIIGPRSALFTPFPDIGLIVIDEEHESAYKSEQSPRYHARETAIHIAQENGASVILGSATPSVEAYYNARMGRYKLFTLTHRALGNELPTVYTEDLREELKSGNRSILSRRLQQLITDRLSKKQQIMLFLNKRGYAGFISCRSCGHVMKCPHCDISLTSHRNGKLVCHYCGYEQPMVNTCPECGSKYISGFRAGTQQIETIINKMYPQAKTLRMDMDTTSKKNGHEQILSAFANHEADILIGTQMIVKGHDFPDVTLVGILAADMSLYSGGYKAAERTFQLLTQAAGRAGRADIPGEVVIQTYTPDNYSVQMAAKQDYEGFYREEIAFRQMMGYPPVCNMLKVSISSSDEDRLERMAEELSAALSGGTGRFGYPLDSEHALDHGHLSVGTQNQAGALRTDGIEITGPVNAGVYKINDIYTKVLYAKSDQYEELISFKDRLDDYYHSLQTAASVSMQFELCE